MDFIIKFLDVLALVIQFIGVWLMYKNSPINKMLSGTGWGDDGAKKRKELEDKNKLIRCGFLILAIGIGLSLISLIIKDFIPIKLGIHSQQITIY